MMVNNVRPCWIGLRTPPCRWSASWCGPPAPSWLSSPPSLGRSIDRGGSPSSSSIFQLCFIHDVDCGWWLALPASWRCWWFAGLLETEWSTTWHLALHLWLLRAFGLGALPQLCGSLVFGCVTSIAWFMYFTMNALCWRGNLGLLYCFRILKISL